MWVILAFLSAFLLGCYEVNKKMSLNGNAVIPVLFFNTLFSSLIFLPFIVLSYATDVLDGSLLYVPRVPFETHVAVFIKAVIVLSSWIFGYFALPCASFRSFSALVICKYSAFRSSGEENPISIPCFL